MVLAAALGTDHPGSLIVAAITRVYTIAYVAEMIGEDEDWLHDLTIDMDFEDGRLTVYGVGEDGVTALTDFGGGATFFDNLVEVTRMSEPEA